MGRLTGPTHPRSTRWALRVALLLLGLWLLGPGCATHGSGLTHVVRPGENIYRIALYYQVDQREILRANRIRDVSAIPVGARLRIPGARRSQPKGSLVAAESSGAPQVADRARARREGNLSFAWPLQGRISSGFGRRSGRPHEGIDIPARSGRS